MNLSRIFKKKQELTTGLILHKPDLIRDIVFSDALSDVDIPTEIETEVPYPDFQDGCSKCVLESYSYLAKLQDLKETNQEFELSADFGYIIAKVDIDKNREHGTSLLTGAKVAVDYGFPEETYFSDTEKFWGTEDYWDKGRMSPMVFYNAKIHSKKSYIRASGIGFGNVDLKELQQMIYQREGAVIAIRGQDSKWNAVFGFPEPPDLNSKEKIFYHAIVVTRNWKLINGELHILIANWWSPQKTKEVNGKAFAWLNWEKWKPHIWGCYSTIDRPNTDFPKTLMLKRIQLKDTFDQYIVKKEQKFKIPDEDTLTLLNELEILMPLEIVEKEEFDKYIDRGIFPSQKLMEWAQHFLGISKDIFEKQ